MNVVIIKYNAGNIRSVYHALSRLGIEARITADHYKIRAADKVIFPGVGEASTTMTYLKKQGLDKLIVSLKQPVLGICLGMQLMCRHSEENNVDCLGIFNNRVKLFKPEHGQEFRTKVPHMGWNSIHVPDNRFIPAALEDDYVYFVHSYYAELSDETAAKTNYIVEFSAALQKNNFYATQFHPEKSGSVGEKVLKAFIDLEHD